MFPKIVKDAWAVAFCFVLALAGCGGGRDNQGDGAARNTGGDQENANRGGTGAAADTMSIAGGFQTPESILWDADADIYLVSNINGDPLAHDDNGFISRVSPEGRIDSLKWIDGAAADVRLNAPKGLAVHEDTLFVADIDTVRVFDRKSGRPLGARGVPGATFLNDLTTTSNGTLYVTDSGLGPGFKPSGTDAIYRFNGARAVALATGAELKNPNGIVADGDSLIYVTFAGNIIGRVSALAAGSARQMATTPTGQLDGIVRFSDGTLLVSSWEAKAVYRIPASGGAVTTVVDGVPSPADIGWDGRRNRVLIPLFQANRLVVRRIG